MALGPAARRRWRSRPGPPTMEAALSPTRLCDTSRPGRRRPAVGCAGRAKYSAGDTCTRAPEGPL
eukprot:3265318-Alexandrium_andersonii.AAC.1